MSQSMSHSILYDTVQNVVQGRWPTPRTARFTRDDWAEAALATLPQRKTAESSARRIFGKLGLTDIPEDNRRVLAVSAVPACIT